MTNRLKFFGLCLLIFAAATGGFYVSRHPELVRAAINGVITINARITGVTAPTADSDAATKGYVTTAVAASVTWAGYTTSTYTGNLGHLKGANQKCDASVAGSHWASIDEIVKLGASYPNTDNPWVRSNFSAIYLGTTYYTIMPEAGWFSQGNRTSPFDFNCASWTDSTNNTNYNGMYWWGTDIGAGQITADVCSGLHKLACVK